jgi:hypothetical protein
MEKKWFEAHGYYKHGLTKWIETGAKAMACPFPALPIVVKAESHEEAVEFVEKWHPNFAVIETVEINHP